MLVLPVPGRKSKTACTRKSAGFRIFRSARRKARLSGAISKHCSSCRGTKARRIIRTLKNGNHFDFVQQNGNKYFIALRQVYGRKNLLLMLVMKRHAVRGDINQGICPVFWSKAWSGRSFRTLWSRKIITGCRFCALTAKQKGKSCRRHCALFDGFIRRNPVHQFHQCAFHNGAQPQDLVKFGLIPEFVGRVPVMVSLDSLDKNALKQKRRYLTGTPPMTVHRRLPENRNLRRVPQPF